MYRFMIRQSMPVSKNDTGTRAMGKIAKLKFKYDLDREMVVDRHEDARRAFYALQRNEGELLS
jgi:hypothetical protein